MHLLLENSLEINAKNHTHLPPPNPTHRTGSWDIVAPKIKLMEQKGNFMWFSLSSLSSETNRK